MTACRIDYKTSNVLSRYIGVRPRNHCCCGKAISFTCSDYVSLALGIEHAMRMRRIILSYVACLDVFFFYFPRYLINGRIFNIKKVIEHKACFYFLYTTFG